MTSMLCVNAAVESLPWWKDILFGVLATIIALFIVYAIFYPRLSFYFGFAIIKGDYLKFQIRNQRLFQLLNLQVKAFLCSRLANGDIEYEEIPLQEESFGYLSGRFQSEDDNTILLISKDPYSETFLKDKTISLEVVSTKSVSGTLGVSKKRYTIDDLYYGDFIRTKLYSDTHKLYVDRTAFVRSAIIQMIIYSTMVVCLTSWYCWLGIKNGCSMLELAPIVLIGLLLVAIVLLIGLICLKIYYNK